MSYVPPRDGCMSDGASAVDAHPVEDSPTAAGFVEVGDMLKASVLTNVNVILSICYAVSMIRRSAWVIVTLFTKPIALGELRLTLV